MSRLAVIFSLGLALAAWTRPAVPTRAPPVTERSEQLDYVVFAVNNATRVVPAGGELVVAFGDTIEVKEATLKDGARAPRQVGVVGFKRPGRRKGDDRGVAFTTEDLKAKASEGKKGERFAVLATSRGQLNGVVFIRLVPPVLRYAELSVNGVPRVLRDGEPLTVKGSDQVKVDKVVTNLESNAGVLFEIGGVKGEYTVSFRRGGAVFARIPLRVLD